MAKSKAVIDDPVVLELDAIKRLLILTLLRADASQSEISGALGIDQSQISRMFQRPKKKG